MNSLIAQGPLALFAAFVVIHALVDFPLQGDYISKQKARRHADNQSAWIVGMDHRGGGELGGKNSE